MIPRKNIDEILDATKIEDVISDFVELRRNGANYKACCPFHDEKTPSFVVSPAKGIYKCFGCGKSGTALGFVMDHENMSYVDALKYLANKYHIKVEERELTPEELAKQSYKESLLQVNTYAGKVFKENLLTNEGNLVGKAYFHSRNLTDETIDKWGLGWCLSTRDGFTRKALEAGYKSEYLVTTGLSLQKEDGKLIDRFYDRAMFPIHALDGQVIAFGGRTLRKDLSNISKYQNSPESEIYEKRKTLYGLYFAKAQMAREKKCYLVEGYLDVLQMHQRGITNVVASSGTSLTVEQVKLIHRFADKLTIIYDGDGAGIKAALRGIDLALADDLEVKVVLLEGGQDPDDFAKTHSLEEVQEYIASHEEDFLTFKSRMLLKEAGEDPYSKGTKINDIVDSLSVIPDSIKRELSMRKVSEMFSISFESVAERVSKKRREAQIHEQKIAENQQSSYASARQAGTQASQPQHAPAKAPKKARSVEDITTASEHELIEYLVVSGCKVLPLRGTEEQYTVAEFIDSQLQADNLMISDPLYLKIYNLFFDYYDAGLTETQIHNRLLENEDDKIKTICAEFLTEKYELTVKSYVMQLTAEETRLANCVPKAVQNFKIKVLQRKCEELSQDFKAETDPEKQKAIMAEMKRYKGLQVNLEKAMKANY